MVHLEVAAWFAQDNLKVIHLHPLERIISVTNSSSGLIFVKMRRSDISAKIRAKLKFCDFVVLVTLPGDLVTLLLEVKPSVKVNS